MTVKTANSVREMAEDRGFKVEVLAPRKNVRRLVLRYSLDSK